MTKVSNRKVFEGVGHLIQVVRDGEKMREDVGSKAEQKRKGYRLKGEKVSFVIRDWQRYTEEKEMIGYARQEI